MNWENYDKLVAYLEDLRERAPETFDYRNPHFMPVLASNSNVHCGCVAAHVNQRMLAGEPGGADRVLQAFLGVTREETWFLWNPCRGGKYNPELFAGVAGITEALSRLAEVASHYERVAPATAWVGDEAAFLAEMRAFANTISAVDVPRGA